MAKKKPVHVTPRGDGWAVMREGNKRASSVHRTQKEAEKAGRQAARKDRTEFYLHNKQGRIRERDSYGKDTYPPVGGRSKMQVYKGSRSGGAVSRVGKQPDNRGFDPEPGREREPEPRPRLPLLSGGRDPTLAERFEEELYGFGR